MIAIDEESPITHKETAIVAWHDPRFFLRSSFAKMGASLLLFLLYVLHPSHLRGLTAWTPN
jgi:hypothetical protein